MVSDYTQIIEGCKRHDRRSQRALYDEMAPMAMGLCMRYTGSRDEAQDLVQDGFIRVFRHIWKVKDATQLRSWVYKVMLNVCLTHCHRHRLPVAEIQETADLVTAPLDPFADEEIVEALQQIAPQQRLVFNLIAVEDYSYRDAAAEMHCTETNVRALYSRARSRMRELLTENENDNENENQNHTR